MKIVVIGGRGVFGSRLVTLLQRDGHDVIVAGRTGGAGAIAVDRGGDLSPIFAQTPDVVVDAAGPFHAYRDDPYHVPRACISHHVNYLDLADDAGFCAGISALDDDARRGGCFCLVRCVERACVIIRNRGRFVCRCDAARHI